MFLEKKKNIYIYIGLSLIFRRISFCFFLFWNSVMLFINWVVLNVLINFIYLMFELMVRLVVVMFLGLLW